MADITSGLSARKQALLDRWQSAQRRELFSALLRAAMLGVSTGKSTRSGGRDPSFGRFDRFPARPNHTCIVAKGGDAVNRVFPLLRHRRGRTPIGGMRRPKGGENGALEKVGTLCSQHIVFAIIYATISCVTARLWGIRTPGAGAKIGKVCCLWHCGSSQLS